jgi:hypothetical protein
MSIAKFITFAGEADFEGIERDLIYRPDLGIEWEDSFGGTPIPCPIWGSTPFVHDMVDFQFTLWTGATNGANIEAFLPGFSGGSGWIFTLILPGDPSFSAMPGFGQWSGTYLGWQFLKCTLNKPIESMGRKAPIVPLWGYSFDCHMAANGYGVGGNETGGVTPSLTSPPAVLSQKFVAHQIQDWTQGACPLPVPSGAVFTGVQHGRRRDAAMALDHLDAATMASIVTWYRGQAVGTGPFSLHSDQPFGPGQPNTCLAWPMDLNVSRVGAWWEAKLSLSLNI